MRAIRIKKTPVAKGQCPVRPPLDGSKGNPMRFCTKAKGHKGKHSWHTK